MSASNSLDSFDAFYRSESKKLLYFFRKRVGSDLAPDLMQDAFARVLRSGPFERIDNPPAYLNRTAHNVLVDWVRRKMREQNVIFEVDEGRDAPTPPEQTWQIEAADMRRAYWRALRAMQPRTRRIFLMHRLRSMTYAKIAERVGITDQGVQYHMMRALALCREAVIAGEE